MDKTDTPKSNDGDTTGRRCRFAPMPSGKRIVLGDRDMEILRWLYRYRYLRQSHLLKLLRPRSSKRFVERLGDLYHETGLVNRPTAASSFDVRATPMLYEITPLGVEWLAAQGALPHRAVTFSRQSRRAFSPQLPHTMMIIEALLKIEQATFMVDGERFVPVDEILERAPETTRAAPNPMAVPVVLTGSGKGVGKKSCLIPDALYGIEYEIDGEKLYRFWALECERTSPAWRSTNAASSTAAKQAAYDNLIASGACRTYWGIPNLKLNVVRASR